MIYFVLIGIIIVLFGWCFDEENDGDRSVIDIRDDEDK